MKAPNKFDRARWRAVRTVFNDSELECLCWALYDAAGEFNWTAATHERMSRQLATWRPVYAEVEGFWWSRDGYWWSLDGKGNAQRRKALNGLVRGRLGPNKEVA